MVDIEHYAFLLFLKMSYFHFRDDNCYKNYYFRRQKNSPLEQGEFNLVLIIKQLESIPEEVLLNVKQKLE